MGTGQNFYSDEEAEEILRIASREMPGGAMDRERLLATAAELGISPEAVARAEEQMAMKREHEVVSQSEERDRIEFKKHQRSDFMSHFGSYVGTNAFMIGIWWFTGQGYFWPFWVLAGWGIGIVADFFETYLSKGGNEKAFRRWQLKRNRRQKRLGTIISSPEVEAALDEIVPKMSDMKLNVIKELRDRFDLELKEAKDLVDSYYQRHGI